MADIVQSDARRQRTSISGVVRGMITRHYKLDQPKRELPFANLYRSGHTDDASRLEEILAEEWADWIEKDSFSDR